MTGLILGLGIPFLYTLIGMVVHRQVYIHQFTAWQRWINEDPDGRFKINSYHEPKPRKEVSMETYLRKSGRDTPLIVAGWWWLYAIAYPLRKFCQPTVKIPSVPKIDELEKL